MARSNPENQIAELRQVTEEALAVFNLLNGQRTLSGFSCCRKDLCGWNVCAEIGCVALKAQAADDALEETPSAPAGEPPHR